HSFPTRRSSDLVFFGLFGDRSGRARAQPLAPRGGGELPPRRARPHRFARGRAAHSAQPTGDRALVLDLHLSALGADLLVYTGVVRRVSARRTLALAAQSSQSRAHGRLHRARGFGRSRSPAQRPDDRDARGSAEFTEGAAFARRLVFARRRLRYLPRQELVAQSRRHLARRPARASGAGVALSGSDS